MRSCLYLLAAFLCLAPFLGLCENPPTGERTWTSAAGSTMRATLMRVVGDFVELKTSQGAILKLTVAQLSDQDRTFLADQRHEGGQSWRYLDAITTMSKPQKGKKPEEHEMKKGNLISLAPVSDSPIIFNTNGSVKRPWVMQVATGAATTPLKGIQLIVQTVAKTATGGMRSMHLASLDPSKTEIEIPSPYGTANPMIGAPKLSGNGTIYVYCMGAGGKCVSNIVEIDAKVQ